MADTIKISELTEYTSAVGDSLLIPLDDGTKTYKCPVGHFNSGAAASAKAYADKAAASAESAAKSLESTKQTASDISTNTSAAKDAAREAEDAKNATVQLKADTERIAGNVNTYVKSASDSAESAADSADDAADASSLSKSWAVGGTGKRTDEETNNAKYWASVAGAAAGGGVLSFNGRSGYVVPMANDYTADQVKRGEASTVETSLTELEKTAKDATNVPVGIIVESKEEYPEISGGETLGVIIGKIKAFLTMLRNKIPKRLPAQSLTAAGGSLTFTDSSITTTSLIDVYATIPNIAPSAISAGTGTCTVTFDAQSAAFDVCITVRN